MILFGADQLSIWCVPIAWLVLTDFKLVLTDFPAGRDYIFIVHYKFTVQI